MPSGLRPAEAKPAYNETFKGMRVPWITRWTGEERHDLVSVGRDPRGKARLFYRDGDEIRDKYGILWQREGVTRSGEPQFSQVSAFRQRQAMRHRLCQVCGRKITDRVIHWLMPLVVWEPHPQSGEFLTTSAPTCAECIPVALSQCPHLKAHDWKMLHVLDYELWGVSGGAVYYDASGEIQRANSVRFAYPDRMAYDQLTVGSIMAKQQLVVLTKFKEVSL